jgi:hypothetical protein
MLKALALAALMFFSAVAWAGFRVGVAVNPGAVSNITNDAGTLALTDDAGAKALVQ